MMDERAVRVRGGALQRLGVCLILTSVTWGAWLGAGTTEVPRAQAATLRVCASECDYAHIRDAVAAAAPGETIIVASGTYAEQLDIEKSLTLLGVGAPTTAIVGNADAPTVSIGVTNQAAVVLLSGLTIERGHSLLSGGGIYSSGTLTLINSTVSNNSSAGNGGGIYSGGTLTLINSTVANNGSYGSGGGIASDGALRVIDSVVSNNTAYYGSGGASGGGIYGTDTMTLTNSTVISNSALRGGGIYSAHMLMLANSTIISNSDLEGLGSGGGGIYGSGTLTLVDSTVAHNQSHSAGGGIASDGALRAIDSTLSGNAASQGGGIFSTGTLALTATILAGNAAADRGPDCVGSLTAGRDNLIQSPSGCAFDKDSTLISSQDPHLGPLQDNGGGTLTMLPQPGSPAIDAVPTSNCALHTDQRGRPRPDPADASGACDIGAVEVQDGPSPLLVSITTAPNAQVLIGVKVLGPHGVVYRTSLHAMADAQGQVLGYLRIAYIPAQPAQMVLTVTVRTSSGVATRTIAVGLRRRHQPAVQLALPVDGML
jgi:predicted outer membrane repeat protein